MRNISPFDSIIRKVVTSNDIRIASPYINIDYLKVLIALAKEWKLLTDINEWLISSKNRVEIQDFIISNKGKIRHCVNLHAKVIIGEQEFVMGSANLTTNGLTKKNEVSALIKDSEALLEIKEWFDFWWSNTQCPTVTEISDLIASLPENLRQVGIKKITSNAPQIKSQLKNVILKNRRLIKPDINEKIITLYSEDCNYWWFGINNKKFGSGHVLIDEILPYLQCKGSIFVWKYGGSSYSQRYYEEMKINDYILFWLGEGKYVKEWGLIGTGRIVEVSDKEYKIGVESFFINSTIPYSIGLNPQPNQETRFLKEVFTLEFKPLGNIFRKVGYDAKRSTPITVEKISKFQFDRITKKYEK